MSSDQPDIKFEDADLYEKFMGVWSRMLGSKFIDWMSPDQGKKIIVEELIFYHVHAVSNNRVSQGKV